MATISKRKPMTAAEARLIRAAIKEQEIDDKGDSIDPNWLDTWNNYRKAVKAVVKERSKG